MKIKLGSMIFFGTMKAIFYLVLPLSIIFGLEAYGIIDFSDLYIIGVIVIGCIGIVVTILNHTFKKDTLGKGYAGIIDSVWSAIFIFYVFGGFTIGDGFGNYFIDATIADYTISARFGLQLVAYFLLIAAGIGLMQHIIKTAEIAKNKKYNIKIKRTFEASKFFKVLGIICNLILVAYIISIPISAVRIRPSIVGGGFSFDYNNGSLPTFSDDSLDMSIKFGIDNTDGYYSILNVMLNVGIYVYDCTSVNGSTIEDGTKIGGTSPDDELNFLKFTNTETENFTISIPYSLNFIVLLINNATLVFELSFSARYAGLTAEVGTSFVQNWENQTYIP